MAEKTVITNEDIKNTENYLNSYKFCRQLLNMKNYEDRYFETLEWESESPAEFSLARAKMFEIRHFILDLRNSKEKLLLYYHYVRGETVERCGELLGISRSSAFRLKKKALEMAFERSVSIGKNLVADRF